MDPHERYPTPGNKPSAPPVPRELLSARPAMTRVIPQSPDRVPQRGDSPQAPPLPQTPRQPTPEEEAERQQRLEYLRNLRSKDNKRGSHKKGWIITIIILLLIAAAVSYAYYYINKPAKSAGTTDTTTTQNNETQPQAQTPATDQVTQKDYDSTNFGLSLSYPSNWVLSDSANALTIVSPTTELPGADGQKKKGAVVVTFRHQQASPPEYASGNAVAVLDSKNVTYTAPNEGQRGTTYLSYLQYASTTVKGALDGIYVTGNSAYKKVQAVPKADIARVDPLITVTFVTCDSSCTPTSSVTQVNGEAFVATDANTAAENIIKSLKL